jgi:hypothetical protein
MILNNKHRDNIIRKARKLIKNEIINYNDLPVGQQESILDEYIEKVCISKGATLADFYFLDGQTLNKLLNR